jgi:hypothetical protein
LLAIWHVRNDDRARLRAEMAVLEARLHRLDRRKREAINRQRYSRSAEEAARAGDDLKNLVTEMERLMTRSRAVEGKLLLLQKLAEESVDPGISLVGVDHDPALSRLPKDLGQPGDRKPAGFDDVGQHLPWTDGRQLVNVSDQQ